MTPIEILYIYGVLKNECTIIDQFEELAYSKLAGDSIDQFGVQWGFMNEQ